jgi:hypothetical protein
VLSNSERYRKAAESCRRTAKTSMTPAEWLGFAADWDKMAERAENLAAREFEFLIERYVGNPMQSTSIH